MIDFLSEWISNSNCNKQKGYSSSKTEISKKTALLLQCL